MFRDILGKVRGLGNRLRHEYDAVDARQIWQIARNELPLLAQKCRDALKGAIE
ncbi:MAG: HepT-like ribonuclease domain-containing protein [Rhodomicrobium sp.]